MIFFWGFFCVFSFPHLTQLFSSLSSGTLLIETFRAKPVAPAPESTSDEPLAPPQPEIETVSDSIAGLTVETARPPLPPPPPVATMQVLDSGGYRCLRCGYGQMCEGCAPHLDEEPISTTQAPSFHGSTNSHTPTSNFRVNLQWARPQLYNTEFDAPDRNDEDPAQQVVTEGESALDLHSCLRLFTAEEQLSPEEAWYCRQCKDFRQAHKQLQLHRLPSHLIVQLKRFSFTTNPNGYSAFSDKIESLIDFPLTGLDMSEFCSESAVLSAAGGDPMGDTPGCELASTINPDDRLYDLYAVSNHSGSTSGGHYYSYVRSLSQSVAQANDPWYCFDDSSVRSISADQIVTSAAYVLFYVRRSSMHEFREQLVSMQSFQNGTVIETDDSAATASSAVSSKSVVSDAVFDSDIEIM